MIKKFTPKVFSEEEFQDVSKASAEQDGSNRVPKSIDKDYPVFENPINAKVLSYVPNLTVVKPDGTIDMAKDEGAFHAIRYNHMFMYKRCYSGIINNYYDGNCPFCNCVGEVWDLFNIEWEQLCKQKGVDPNDETDPLKEDRRKLLNNMAITKAERWVTFPIVVVACEEGKIKPKLKEDNTLDYEIMWYTCKERTIYKDKWLKGLGNVTDDDGVALTHPAGQWVILDYTYTPKNAGDKHTKMGSANALQVSVKTMKGYEEVSAQLDQECIAKGWTPKKATETVVANFYLDMADVEELSNDAMKATRDKLVMLKSVEAPTAPSDVQSAINSFSAKAVEEGVNQANAGGTAGVVTAGVEGSAPQVPIA